MMLKQMSLEQQDIVEPLIDLRVAEQQALAGAKIIEVEQNTIGALLDISV